MTVSAPVTVTVTRRLGAASLASLRFSLPSGWATDRHVGIKRRGDPPDGIVLGFWHLAGVYTNRCQWADALLSPQVDTTVEGLAAAIATAWGSDASAPVEVVVDGFRGNHMVLTIFSDVDFADCDERRFNIWRAVDDTESWFPRRDQIEELWIIDIDGDFLLIDATYWQQLSVEDRAELQEIIASVQIGPE